MSCGVRHAGRAYLLDKCVVFQIPSRLEIHTTKEYAITSNIPTLIYESFEKLTSLCMFPCGGNIQHSTQRPVAVSGNDPRSRSFVLLVQR